MSVHRPFHVRTAPWRMFLLNCSLPNTYHVLSVLAPRPAVTHYHALGGLNSRNVFFHGSGGQSLQSISLGPNQGVGRSILPLGALRTLRCLPLWLRWLPAFLNWCLYHSSPQGQRRISLCSIFTPPPCVPASSLPLPLSYKESTWHGIQAHPNNPGYSCKSEN